MATQPYSTGADRPGFFNRLATETKQAFKTTEFWAFIAVLVMILIAGNSIEGEEGGTDFFAADKVWLYVTILTVGYMISRGLAKAGSQDPYWDRPNTGTGDSLGERVKTAATVLKDGEGAVGSHPRDGEQAGQRV